VITPNPTSRVTQDLRYSCGRQRPGGAEMLCFYESFFPVAWIAFVLYWRIKAADTKTASASKGIINIYPTFRQGRSRVTSGLPTIVNRGSERNSDLSRFSLGWFPYLCSRSLQSRQWRVQGTASNRAREIGFWQVPQIPNVPCLILLSAPSTALKRRPLVS
jgi:hypothetical protein